MTPVAATYSGLDQRASPRTDVYARVPMATADGRTAIVTLVNISSDGALIRTEHALDDDMPVTLSFAVLGKIAAHAVWNVGGRAGIQFNERIEERDYLALLKALGVKPAE